jgi:hypothetical protein
LVIEGIVKILHLSLQVVDRLLLVGVAEGKLLIVLLEVGLLLLQVEALLFEVSIGVIQFVYLPFVFTFHLLGLSLQLLVGIVDLLYFEEGFFVFELWVVAGHRRSFLTHSSVIISISASFIRFISAGTRSSGCSFSICLSWTSSALPPA